MTCIGLEVTNHSHCHIPFLSTALGAIHVKQLSIDFISFTFSVCDLPNNPLFITCNTLPDVTRPGRPRPKRYSNDVDTYATNPGVVSERFDELVALIPPEDVLVERTERGVYLSYNKGGAKKPSQYYGDYSQESLNDTDVVLPSTVYSTNNHYSRLGE